MRFSYLCFSRSLFYPRMKNRSILRIYPCTIIWIAIMQRWAVCFSRVEIVQIEAIKLGISLKFIETLKWLLKCQNILQGGKNNQQWAIVFFFSGIIWINRLYLSRICLRKIRIIWYQYCNAIAEREFCSKFIC